MIAANRQIKAEYYAVFDQLAFTDPRTQLSVKVCDFDFKGLINFIESCSSAEVASLTPGGNASPVAIEIKASAPVNVNISSLKQWLELQNSTGVAVKDYEVTDLGYQPGRVRSSISGLYRQLSSTSLRSEMDRIRQAVHFSWEVRTEGKGWG